MNRHKNRAAKEYQAAINSKPLGLFFHVEGMKPLKCKGCDMNLTPDVQSKETEQKCKYCTGEFKKEDNCPCTNVCEQCGACRDCDECVCNANSDI